MSTNFLPFNPAAANQESDATYLTDATRVGGAVLDQILPSPLYNKVTFQANIFVAAFAEMMVQKGYSPMDGAGVSGGFNALVAVLANVRTSADFEASIVSIPYATSVTFDADVASAFDLILTGNVSASTLVNVAVGQILTFIIQQDATGGRTFVWPSNLLSTAPICPQPNSLTIQQFDCRPNGQIVPISPLLWITSAGVTIPPLTTSVVKLSVSGNISNAFPRITEEINASSGTITRSLYSAVGYAGFQVTIKNLGSTVNNVLLQCLVPGQTIDGFPTFPVGPYGALTVQSDGTNWVIIGSASVGGQVTKQQIFTSSGTFVPSSALLELGGWVQVLAVGGGGGGGTPVAGGAGGGGGGQVTQLIVQLAGPVTVTIGAGGAIASIGGTTTFGTLVTAVGGSPGSGINGGSSGGSSGCGGGIGTNVGGGGGGAGGPGQNAQPFSGSNIYGVGGPGLYGFAGGGSAGSGGAGNGGGSFGVNGAANTGGGGGGNAAGGSGYTSITWVE